MLDYQRIPNWRSVVQLKNNAKQLWDVAQSKQEWGLLLHQAMANIHYLEDADKVLKDLKLNGLIDKEQAQQLTARINELLSDPEITLSLRKNGRCLPKEKYSALQEILMCQTGC